MLQSMGSQRVRHNLATEQQQNIQRNEYRLRFVKYIYYKITKNLKPEGHTTAAGIGSRKRLEEEQRTGP